MHPVTSPAGIVFEKSTILAWLEANGSVCPVTGQALVQEELRRVPLSRAQARNGATAFILQSHKDPTPFKSLTKFIGNLTCC